MSERYPLASAQASSDPTEAEPSFVPVNTEAEPITFMAHGEPLPKCIDLCADSDIEEVKGEIPEGVEAMEDDDNATDCAVVGAAMDTMQTEENKKDECQICKKKFTDKYFRNKLTRHICYSCHICNAKFSRKGALVEHLLTHDEQIMYQCDFCDRTFVKHINLLAHFESHRVKCLLECPVCKKRLSNKIMLRHHLLTHSEYKYKCDKCHKSFPTRHKLKLHLTTHSGHVVCALCYETVTQSYYKRHFRLRHPNI